MPNHTIITSPKSKTKVSKPQMYDVVMHNDDITTMEFVVDVLCRVFYKSAENATQLMLDVHTKGAAIVGTYTYDIALSKTYRATEMARAEGFPFRMTIEPSMPF